MKRKYWIILAVFFVTCTILPFFVELLYEIGKTHPVIRTNYSQSDVLGYIATVIGLMISVIAIIISINAEKIDIGIHHSLTISDKDNEALLIEIRNKSAFDCTVNSVELCDKKARIYSHLLRTPPFDVKGKKSTEFVIEIKQITDMLSRINKSGKRRNVKYCIRLAGNECLYLSAKELYISLDSIEKHCRDLLKGGAE